MTNILKSFLIIVAVAAVAGGATFAYFSDTETSTGNTFAAGSLDLELGAQSALPFNVSNLVPGQSGEGKVRLTNVGNIPGKLNVNLTHIVEPENGITEPEQNLNGEYTPNSGELGMFLNFTAFVDVNKNGSFDAGDIQLAYNGVLPYSQINYFAGWKVRNPLLNWNDIMTLSAGQSVDLIMKWELPTESQDGNYNINIAQTDGLNFDTEFMLEQAH